MVRPGQRGRRGSLAAAATGPIALVCAALGSAGASCGGPPAPERMAPPPSAPIIATERAGRGGRLVAVRADGARQRSITDLPAGELVVDQNPVVSPDGHWVVFASNRGGRPVGNTNLWIVSRSGGDARPLSEGDFVDRDPRLSSDGRTLIFASNRRGSFDLYRAVFDPAEGAMGAPERLTSDEGDELSPSLSPGDDAVVYMAIDADGHSRLWRLDLEPGATPVAISDGPADLTPAWGRDGRIAFASPLPGREDPDLFVMHADGSGRSHLVDAPLTDETGPRWSADGRYLFAIGVYRSTTDGKPLLASIVVLDTRDKQPVLRALHDPSAVESRIGLALAPETLDAAALRGNPMYVDALRDVMEREVIRQADEERR